MGRDFSYIARNCERAVITAYGDLRTLGTPDPDAFQACTTLYRIHHPEASLSEARRQLGDGAVSVNGAKVPADRALGPDDVLHGAWILLRKGKRDWAVVVVGDAP